MTSEDYEIYLCRLNGEKYAIFDRLKSYNGIPKYAFNGRIISFTEKTLFISATDLGPGTIINLGDNSTDEIDIIYQSDSILSKYLASVLSTYPPNSIEHLVAIATIIMTLTFTGEFNENGKPIYHPLEYYKGNVTIHRLGIL